MFLERVRAVYLSNDAAILYPCFSIDNAAMTIFLLYNEPSLSTAAPVPESVQSS